MDSRKCRASSGGRHEYRQRSQVCSGFSVLFEVPAFGQILAGIFHEALVHALDNVSFCRTKIGIVTEPLKVFKFRCSFSHICVLCLTDKLPAVSAFSIGIPLSVLSLANNGEHPEFLTNKALCFSRHLVPLV